MNIPEAVALMPQIALGPANRASHDVKMPPVRPIETPALLLRRASEPRPPALGPDDYDVISKDGNIIGRIVRARITPATTPWMWSLVDGAETLATGYAASRDTAMQAAAEALVMTDCLPGLMLKRIDRRDEECYDVMSNGQVVGHVRLSDAAPAAASWVWAVAFDRREKRKATHGYEATREAAMQAFAKAWQGE
jgi:hypothetical protein